MPDTTLLAQVGDKTIRVRDYVERYFNSYAEYRPAADSAGRRKFLETMIDKEVIAAVARSVNRPESFEERAIMKAHIQRVLGNILFQRVVADSVQVSDSEGQAVYEKMSREVRLQRVGFGSLETAERVRKDLISGRTSWSRAWELRVRVPGDTATTSSLAWRSLGEMPPEIAAAVGPLPVGGISAVIPEPPTNAVYRVADQRLRRLQSYAALRDVILDGLRAQKGQERQERLLAGLRATAGLAFDSANVAWTAAQFPHKISGQGARLTIDVTVPDIAPQDTGRVLATYRGGQVTVGRLLRDYVETAELRRPSLDTPDAVRSRTDLLVLEPELAEMARQRGLDRDSLAMFLIDRRREEIAVDHLFQDSIQSRVFVPPAERRKYYKENEHRFVTAPSLTAAIFYVKRAGEADTLVARLEGGTPAREIVHADSIAGLPRGWIESRTQENRGRQFEKLLFEEMRVGQVQRLGPDTDGGYNILQVLDRSSGRKVAFEEADAQIDEYLQQEAAERLLSSFTQRHRQRMRIVSHPELLMSIRLVDPESTREP